MEWYHIVGLALVALVAWLWREIYAFYLIFTQKKVKSHSSIRLIEEQAPSWKNKHKAEGFHRDLEAAGFELLAVYRVPEVQNMLLGAFRRPSDGWLGAILDVPGHGCFVEVAIPYSDLSGLTVSSNPMVIGLDQMPGQHKESHPDADLATLLARTAELIEEKPILPLDRESFAAHVQDEYLREIKWRNDKGGVSAEEMRRIAEANGTEVDDEMIAEATRTMREEHAEHLRREALAQFLDQHHITPARFEDWSERLLVVLANDTRAELLDTLDERFDLSQEQRARLGRLASSAPEAAKAFDAAFAELFTDGKALGSVEQPTAAAIYLLPEEKG